MTLEDVWSALQGRSALTLQTLLQQPAPMGPGVSRARLLAARAPTVMLALTQLPCPHPAQLARLFQVQAPVRTVEQGLPVLDRTLQDPLAQMSTRTL
jgi:hypothetical protein